MVEDAVGPDRRTGDVFALYAEIYALRLEHDVVALTPRATTALPGEVDVPGDGSDPKPRRWRSRR